MRVRPGTDRGCSIAGSVLGASLRGKVLEEVDGRGPTVAFVLGQGIRRGRSILVVLAGFEPAGKRLGHHLANASVSPRPPRL